MALLNKVWRESRYVPPGAEPGLTTSRDFFENVQNIAVQELAKERFAYPSADAPQLKTFTNRPEHTIGVRGPGGELLFPDIVVMDTTTTEVYLLAELETSRSLRLPDTAEKWQAFASVGRLLVYVPYGEEELARSMIRGLRAKPMGLRAWKRNLGQNRIETVEVLL
ncbi:MAG TPA: hypothetical protein VFD32_10745 [Dehalococcoidia bacterium]|nr:hypothetical protein [Dehalococcoidia bacterium]